MTTLKVTLTLVIIGLLTACSSQYGRYQQRHDSVPTQLPAPHQLKDAVPRAEPLSRGGNKAYQVRGKHYQVLTSAKGFEQTGIASWYGNKFHGHLTSNGEIYDMYGMSAAHKNLPLPTYVKVTNLANNKTVIVRVNDRGPFHQSRVIDLSYSAAYKLGMLKTGTAKVHIAAITKFDSVNNAQVAKDKAKATNVSPVIATTSANAAVTAKVGSKQINNELVKPKPVSPIVKANSSSTSNLTKPLAGFNKVIQVFATRNKALAENTANALTSLYQLPVNLPEQAGIYRIQLGPFKQASYLQQILKQLQDSGYPNAFIKQL